MEALARLAQESPYPSTKEASLMARGVSLEQSRQASSQREEGEEVAVTQKAHSSLYLHVGSNPLL